MCNDDRKVEKEVKMIIGGLNIPLPIIKMKTYKHGVISERYQIKEEDDKYIVTVELPGVKKEDIKLYVNENAISISAKTSVEIVGRKEEYKYKIKLEDPVEPESAKAKYFEGLLTIELRKKKIGREVEVE